MRSLCADLLDPELWSSGRGHTLLFGVPLVVWGTWALVRGWIRSKRSADSQYLRRGLGAAHFTAAILCGLAMVWLGAAWKPWLNSAGVVFLVAAASLTFIGKIEQIKLLPGAPPVELINFLAICGAREEACALGETAVRLDPKDSRARFRLARVYREMGRLQDACAQCGAVDPDTLSPAEREALIDFRELLEALSKAEATRSSSVITRWGLPFLGILMLFIYCTGKRRGEESISWKAWIILIVFIALVQIRNLLRLAGWLKRLVFGIPRGSPVVLMVLRLVSQDRRFDLARSLGEARLARKPDDDETRVAFAETLFAAGDPRRSNLMLMPLEPARLCEDSRKRWERLRDELSKSPETPPPTRS